jgi:hypothetical protein
VWIQILLLERAQRWCCLPPACPGATIRRLPGAHSSLWLQYFKVPDKGTFCGVTIHPLPGALFAIALVSYAIQLGRG